MAAISRRVGQVELTEIQRQKEEWARNAVIDFGTGQARQALARYAERGLVHIANNRQDALVAMVREWSKQGLRDPSNNLMIAARNFEVQQANTLAQELRRREGLLSKTSMAIGDQLFHLGDRVLFLRNSYKFGVRNGQFGTITAMQVAEGLLSVNIEDGPRVIVPLKEYQDITLGYATTINRSQSVTTSSTFCLLPEDGDRELGVVQGSRHSHSCKFFVDETTAGPDFKLIGKDLSQSREQVFATDVLRHDYSYVVLQPELQP